jgi:hypothetical protein
VFAFDGSALGPCSLTASTSAAFRALNVREIEQRIDAYTSPFEAALIETFYATGTRVSET